MNRDQELRLAELGDAFKQAISDVINMNEPEPVERYNYGTVEQMPVPTPMPDFRTLKANYQPEIRQVNNGFIVQLGCQSFVFETFDKMSKYLKMYFEDPDGTETKFHKNELF
jgi:hypothetical protein